MSIREEFVLKALEPNTNLSALCREFGVSRKTGYKWIERYESGGVLALRDLSRRPRTSPLGVSPEAVVDLIALRNLHPHWGARKLIWALQKSGARSVPSERTVNRVLERAGLIVRRRLHPKPLPDGTKPDVSADKPNALWTADYKGWWRTADQRRCEPLTVRDQCSRFVLAVHVCRSPRIEEAMTAFERLFELYGLPERMSLRTVSGSGFIRIHSKMVPLTEALAGYTVAIDPSGPPHELWFAHRRIASISLDGPRPVVTVEAPPAVALNAPHGDTKLLNQPALETT